MDACDETWILRRVPPYTAGEKEKRSLYITGSRRVSRRGETLKGKPSFLLFFPFFLNGDRQAASRTACRSFFKRFLFGTGRRFQTLSLPGEAFSTGFGDWTWTAGYPVTAVTLVGVVSACIDGIIAGGIIGWLWGKEKMKEPMISEDNLVCFSISKP